MLHFLRKGTVMVVEDDRSLRTLYTRALLIAGYRVIDVGDGLAALEHIASEGIDAVVLDLGLPRLSGRDVQRELASRPETRKIPVVVVTGTDTSDLDDADVATVLKKPVHPEVVAAAVDAALRRH